MLCNENCRMGDPANHLILELAHSLAVKAARMRRMAWCRPLTVRSAAFRRSAFSLEKAFSIWIEVGTVGRQEQQLGAGRLDGLAHRMALVARQVIDDDDVARRERRHEDLSHALQEAL